MLQVITYIDESDCVTKREKQLYEIALENEHLADCYHKERNKNQEQIVYRDSVLQTRKEHILKLCSILDELADEMNDPEYEAFKAIRKDYIDTNIK
jgi:hypothetical protein